MNFMAQQKEPVGLEDLIDEGSTPQRKRSVGNRKISRRESSSSALPKSPPPADAIAGKPDRTRKGSSSENNSGGKRKGSVGGRETVRKSSWGGESMRASPNGKSTSK